MQKKSEAVYYIPEAFVFKSEMNACAFSVKGEHSKARKVGVAGTLHPLSRVDKVDKNEAGLDAIQEQNVNLINEGNSLVYQLEALQQEVLSLQRNTEVTMGKLYLWKDAARQRQLTLDQQLEIIASLQTRLQSTESYSMASLAGLDEQKKRSRSLLEQLKFQQDTVATVTRALKTRHKAAKMIDVFVCTSSWCCRKTPQQIQLQGGSGSWAYCVTQKRE